MGMIEWAAWPHNVGAQGWAVTIDGYWVEVQPAHPGDFTHLGLWSWSIRRAGAADGTVLMGGWARDRDAAVKAAEGLAAA